MIATEPKAELGEMFDAAGGSGKARVGQTRALATTPIAPRPSSARTSSSVGSGSAGRSTPICPTRTPSTGATQFVTDEQVAEQLACGPDIEEHVDKIKPFIDAGFTEIALVQIGGDHSGRVHRLGRARAAAGPALALVVYSPSLAVGRARSAPARTSAPSTASTSSWAVAMTLPTIMY